MRTRQEHPSLEGHRGRLIGAKTYLFSRLDGALVGVWDAKRRAWHDRAFVVAEAVRLGLNAPELARETFPRLERTDGELAVRFSTDRAKVVRP